MSEQKKKTGTGSGAAKTGTKTGGTKAAAKTGSASRSGAKKSPAKSGIRSDMSKASAARSRSTAKNSVDIMRSAAHDTPDERELHNSPRARQLADDRRKRKYNKHRRLYNFIFYLAITVAVISVVIFLSVTVLFNISTINVELGKNVIYSEEEIIEACGIKPGENLFVVDLEQAERTVKTTLPYIEICDISRKLPSALVITTRAAIPLGRTLTDEGYNIVLSASGRALEYTEEYTGSLKLAALNGLGVGFNGIGEMCTIADPARLETAAELVVGFSLYNIALDSVTFDPASSSVSALYDGRVELVFGPPTQLSIKVQMAAKILNERRIAANESGRLDLSIEGKSTYTPDYLIDSE